MRKIFLLTLILILNNFLIAQDYNKPNINNGVLDLSGYNFEENKVLPLKGEWMFYWNNFYSYSDFQNTELKPDALVDIPKVWTNITLNGQKLPSYGFATYRLTILTDSSLKNFSLYIPDQATAYNIFLNDKLILTAGNPSKISTEHNPNRKISTVDLNLDTNVNELIINISNYNYSKGGIWHPISIGSKEKIDLHFKKFFISDVFLIGIMFILFFFSFSLFIFRRKDFSSLYFSLFSLAVLLRIVFTNTLVLEQLFTNFPYLLSVRMEYLSLPLMVIFFILYLSNLFPKARIKTIDSVFIAVSLVIIGIILLTSNHFFTSLINYFQAVILLAAIYCLYIIFKSLSQKSITAIFIFVGFIFELSSVIIDILISNQIINSQAYIAPIGTTFFIMLLLFSLIYNILQAEREKTTLEGNLETVKRLNEIGLEVIANLNIENVLNVIHEKINNLIKIDNLAIGLYNKTENKLEFIGKDTNGIISRSEDLIDGNKSLSAIAFENDKEIFISDYSSEYKKYFKKYSFYSESRHYDSLIYLPLKIKEKKIGVLTIQKKEKNSFSEFDLKTLENIALFASIAFDNANAYEKIDTNEQKLSAIFETASEGIGLVDKNGYLTFANKSLSQIFGYQIDELLKLNYFSMLHKVSAENNLNFKDLLSGKIDVINTENKFKKHDGTTIWGKLSAKALKNSDGQIEQIVGVFTDIEDIKQNELKVIKANENIKASISYAKRIQTAILPDLAEIATFFSDHFVFYKPRDIVSGDFYWIRTEKNYTAVAAADCTGHGVPGAFMSILSISILNEIVTLNGLSDSGLILDKMRYRIKKMLKQKGDYQGQKEGLDISLYIINNDNLELKFSGANFPLYIVRDNELIILKQDRQPVAIHVIEKEFSTQTFQLQKNDCLYSFTDGFADQLGGEKNSKFMTKNFKKLILSISDKPMQDQKKHLDTVLKNWQLERNQTDDILIIGAKV